MAATNTTTYLITGANRGIGRAIADRLLSQQNTSTTTTLIALVRNPEHETGQSLKSQAKGNDKVILIPYDATSLTSAETAISTLQSTHGITHLDTVLANAGVSNYFGPSLNASPEEYLEHYTANTLGPMQLFRAVLPLLQTKSNSAASGADGGIQVGESRSTFIAISSAVGSTEFAAAGTLSRDNKGRPRGGALPYGTSKAALNHILCKLAGEYPGINFGLLTPGPTKTGFGGAKVNWDNVPNAQDVDTVADGLVKRIEEIEKKKEGEKLVLKDWKGEVIPW